MTKLPAVLALTALSNLFAQSPFIDQEPARFTQINVCAYRLICGYFGCAYQYAPPGTQIFVRSTKIDGNGHNHPGETTPAVRITPNPVVLLDDSGCQKATMGTDWYSGTWELTPTAAGYVPTSTPLYVQTKRLYSPVSASMAINVPDFSHPKNNYLTALAAVRWDNFVRAYYLFGLLSKPQQTDWHISMFRASLQTGGWYDDGVVVPYWWQVWGKDVHADGIAFDILKPSKQAQRDFLVTAAAQYGCTVSDSGSYYHVQCDFTSVQSG